MRCKRCGSEIQDGDMFCGNCGWKVEEKKKPVIPIIIGIVVVVLIAVIGIFWYLHHQEQKKVEENLAKFQERVEEGKKESESDQADTADQEKAEDADEAEEDTEDAENTRQAADPTEGGIHRYEYMISDVTWTQAYQECLDRGGYLVRINSREEYDYIISQLNSRGLSNIQFKIGGMRATDSRDYYWVDESGQMYGDVINSRSYWCASEWMAGEPSYQDGATQEQYLDIFYHQNSGKWVWNDVPDDIMAAVPSFSGKLGYICEYEE